MQAQRWALAGLTAAALVAVGSGGVSTARAAKPDPEVIRSRTIPVTEQMLAQMCAKPGPADPGELTLDLFPDIRVRAEATQVKVGEGGSLEWRGEVPGVPRSEIILVSVNACDGRSDNTILSGTVDLGDQLYDISPLRPAVATVAQLKPGLNETEGGRSDVVRGARSAKAQPARPAARRAAGDVPVVDVLVMYTPSAKAKAGGVAGIGAEIDTAENLANEAYAQSGVTGRLRVVVKAEAVGYTGSEQVDKAQKALSRPKDGLLDEAGPLRDKYGADLVAVITNDQGGSGWCGMGSMPDPPSRITDNQVWSATDLGCISNQSFVHELAHNMGATHDWATDTTVSWAHRGNHGFIAKSGQWRTVMAYSDPCKGCKRLSYFSNPKNTLDGESMGVPADQPGAADNVSVLNASIPAVAAYRRAKVSEADQVRLNLGVSPNDTGTAELEVAGPYERGTDITATATPKPGYRFTGWKLDGKPYGTADTVQVPMNADRALVAEFEVGAAVARTVNVSASPSSAGTVTTAPGGNRFPEGTKLKLQAQPKPGHKFTGWEIDGSDAGGSARALFVVESDHDIVARFTGG